MRSQYDRRDECRGGREEVDSRTDLWRSRSWWNISLEKVWRKSRVGENADEFMKGWMSRNRGMTGVSGARWEVFDPLLLGEEGVAMITEVFEVDDTHELTLAMTEFGILFEAMPDQRFSTESDSRHEGQGFAVGFGRSGISYSVQAKPIEGLEGIVPCDP